MSDNLPPDVVQEELEARFRIPTEVWTDVFKLLPRRVLVQQIAPTCYYFKEISNKNVKNVHVIEKADQLTRKLKDDNLEANQQLENLAANECQLTGQFKLSEIWIREKSQAILRHCPDLFKGCHITLDINGENKDSTLFLESLDQLEGAKPAEIRVIQRVDQLVDYWHHPTFQHCTRVDLYFYSHLKAPRTILMTTFENIYDWLHHKPIGINCDASADQNRCMIIWWNFTHQKHIDLLINRCSEDIQQSKQLIDRRPFLFSFFCWDSVWSGFGQFHRIENKSTGEVLTLERKMHSGQSTHRYRLRRCLAEEEACGKEFYAGIFKPYKGYEEFCIGEKTTKVTVK